ncbi:MAG: dihydrolipoyl dehydrogenase [Planctomycetes bacterium]|nr:dihydrolipoyl dehydrogenase [Planctomycetota bacterium]
MAATDCEVLVIGGGPGGYVAAIRAAQLGKKTAVVERDRLGGICLNWGCIPTKALLKSAEMLDEIRRAEEYGIEVGGVRPDFAKIVKRSRAVADKMAAGVNFLMKKNRVEVIPGVAEFDGAPGRVVVKEEGKAPRRLSAGAVILATGARPADLPFARFDGRRIVSYKEAMVLPTLPERMVIVGAGAIGVEFAYFYNVLGTRVTLIEGLDQVLPIEDEETSKVVARSFAKRGIEIVTSAKVEAVEAGAKGVRVTATAPKGGRKEFEGDLLLLAVGVRGNVEDLGLASIGVRTNGKFVEVDERMRTAAPGLWAIGDVAGPPMLAHVASHEGIVAAEDAAGLTPHPVDYRFIPGCTYCQPQVASLGMTERKAKEERRDVKIGRFPFTASGKAVAAGETEGFVKVIYDARYGELLGAHIVGHGATEMIAELGIAQRLETTPEALLHTMHAHPTLAEAVMEASGAAIGAAIHI